VERVEELESMEFLALVAKGAKGGGALPGEFYALHLVLVLKRPKGGTKWLSISLYGKLRWTDNSACFDRKGSFWSHRSTVSDFPNLSQL
jgi:hypothetical protein